MYGQMIQLTSEGDDILIGIESCNMDITIEPLEIDNIQMKKDSSPEKPPKKRPKIIINNTPHPEDTSLPLGKTIFPDRPPKGLNITPDIVTHDTVIILRGENYTKEKFRQEKDDLLSLEEHFPGRNIVIFKIGTSEKDRDLDNEIRKWGFGFEYKKISI